MAERIPQSVAYLVVFRAFLASDGKSPATGKTIVITISKNGGAFGNPNVGALNATEISSGFYKFTLDTTDTGTLGPIAWRGAEATINDAGDVLTIANAHNAGYDGVPNATANANGGLPILSVGGTTLGYTISTLTTYTGNTPQTGDSYAVVNDANFGNSKLVRSTTPANTLSVDANHKVAATVAAADFAQGAADLVWASASRTLTSATNITSTGGTITVSSGNVSLTAALTPVLHGSIATGGTSNTITLVSGLSLADDWFRDLPIKIHTGTGAGQSRTITGYNGSTRVVTVDRPWGVVPDATSQYSIGWIETPGGAVYLSGVIMSDVTDTVGADVVLIKAKTDQLTFTGSNANVVVADKTGFSLTVAEEAAIADKILGRNIAGGSDGGRTVRQAFEAQRNKVAFDVPGVGQFTVYATDDSTPSWTGAYTATIGASPVTVLDPA
jgi:hypothetical protein